jgi:hypothetical protein
MISAKVLNASIDDNGNLKVATEYTLTDGSKQTGHTRYSAQNFSKDKILEDVKSQCENLMRKTWNLKQNQELVKTLVNDIAYSCESVELVTKPAVTDMRGVELTPAEKITIDDSDPIIKEVIL